MTSPLPDGMMRTRGGARIAVYPLNDPDGPAVSFSIQGIAIAMTTDDAHQLRDILHAAELRAARGDVIT